MPTFQKAPENILLLAAGVLASFPEHAPLVAAKVKIDFILAYPDLDEDGVATNDGITIRGRKALGVTRKLQLKDRVMNRGDAEIVLDGPFIEGASEAEINALLDHELCHLQVRIKKGSVVTDDLGRPMLKLRMHDEEVGWFRCVARRHGMASQERIQARQMIEEAGQFYFPFTKTTDETTVTVSSETHGPVTPNVSSERFHQIASENA